MASRSKLSLLSHVHNSCLFGNICIASLLFAIILIISKFETAIQVHIHSLQKIGQSANPPKGISDHTTLSRVVYPIKKHQIFFPHGGCCLNRPIWIGLADVCQPTRCSHCISKFDTRLDKSVFHSQLFGNMMPQVHTQTTLWHACKQLLYVNSCFH